MNWIRKGEFFFFAFFEMQENREAGWVKVFYIQKSECVDPTDEGEIRWRRRCGGELIGSKVASSQLGFKWPGCMIRRIAKEETACLGENEEVLEGFQQDRSFGKASSGSNG